MESPHINEIEGEQDGCKDCHLCAIYFIIIFIMPLAMIKIIVMTIKATIASISFSVACMVMLNNSIIAC
jgi:hypothetical protein